MPDSTTPDTAAVLNQRSLWATALRHAGVAYLISRLCVMVGAAIVAAELRADDNKIRERLVWGFVGKSIRKRVRGYCRALRAQ